MDETVPFPGKAPAPPKPDAALATGSGDAASSGPASTVTGNAPAHKGATGVWRPETMNAIVPLVSGYEILCELGRGGMGVVYRARNVRLGHEVALKMILAGNTAGTQELARFQLEAVAVARLKHPGIVHLHEFGEHEGKPYFSLEFVEGGSLAGRLKAGPLPAREAALLVAKTAHAMQHAHEQGIIHRDLKPANILLTRDDQPKVADFGLAKDLSNDDGLSRTGALMGTAAYMAPEQAEGRIRDIRPTTDVYALGAILYECLTGRPPFKGTTLHETLGMVLRQDPRSPRQLTPSLPRDLETVCLRCLEKDPKKRYATAADLADDLERFLRGEPVAARPVGVLARGVRWCLRNRAIAASMVAVGITLLLGTIVSLFFGLHAMRVADDEAKARRFANEQRDLADDARRAKEAETIEKENQRQEAVAATKARDAEILKFRNALLNAQLLHINQIWERDPVTAMRMLQDEVACPPEIRDFTWKLFRQMVPRERMTWRDHTGKVTWLSSSPEGDMLASCGPDGIRIRDTETGRLIVSIKEPAQQIAFAPSGQALASTQGGRLMLWHIPSGKFAYGRNAHNERIRSLVFDPMGNLLATSSLDKTVKVWDPNVGKLLDTFPGHDGERGCLRFATTPDGKANTLTVSDSRLGTKVWNLETKQATSWKGFDDGGYEVMLSPNGKTLAFGGTEFGSGEVSRLDLLPPSPEDPTQLRVFRRQSYLGHPRPLRAFAFSSDGKLLASLDSGGVVKVWDTKREIDDWQKDSEYVTLTDTATSSYRTRFLGPSRTAVVCYRRR
ncbi:MAG: serine/threonine-protein kinase [Gemmataceae bacterium]